jgi:hypothetical protein
MPRNPVGALAFFLVGAPLALAGAALLAWALAVLFFTPVAFDTALWIVGRPAYNMAAAVSVRLRQ